MSPASVTTIEPYTEMTTGSSSEPMPAAKPPLVASKGVRFSANIDVREVPHLKDVTPEEVYATWYSQDDFEEIKTTLVVTVRLMMAKKPLDTNLCARGLECRTPAGAKLRKQNKLDALTAVWNEQVSQWKEDRTDEDAISFVYQTKIRQSREIGLKLAAQDARDARQFLSDDLDSSESDLSSLGLGEEVNHGLDQPRISNLLPSAA